MTLATVMIAGVPTLALVGIQLDGKWRRWKAPLIVSVDIKGSGPHSSYVLAVARLEVRADPGHSIVEAVQLLQEKIIATLPRAALEALLEEG